MRDLKNDIEKYLRGELTPAEMNSLERKALNDPFLADALEGAQFAGVENFHADMKSLQASLENRLHSKSGKVVSLWAWPMRIAAGLLVLAVSTFIIVSLLDQNESSTKIAQVKENASPAGEEKSALATDSIRTEDDEDSDRNKVDDRELLSMAKPEEVKPSSVPSRVPPVATAQNQRMETEVPEESPETKQPDGRKSAFHLRESKPLPDSQVYGNAQFKSKDASTSSGFINMDKVTKKSEEVQSEIEPALSYDYKVERKDSTNNIVITTDDYAKRKAVAGAPAESRAADQPKTSAPTSIRGKVTSAEDGTGLPGVNVVIIGTNTGTVTDAEGNYHLTVETPNPELSFSFIGLESTEVEAGDSQEIDVAMNQDVSQLSEVVVVGYGTENKEEEEIPTLEFATPAGGRAAYKKYLEKSLRYPEQALEKNIEGKVTVQFTVESTGKLTDFKVLKGIGYGCDEEVIRLIKKGPKWAATKRDDEPVRDKVKVRMRFRLPKK